MNQIILVQYDDWDDIDKVECVCIINTANIIKAPREVAQALIDGKIESVNDWHILGMVAPMFDNDMNKILYTSQVEKKEEDVSGGDV